MEVAPVMTPAPADPTLAGRKRKADAQDTHNERLSKRLSLLNLEQNGTKMYVTVENPAGRPDPSQAAAAAATTPSPTTKSTSSRKQPRPSDSQQMQLDDDKYKVYIYNIDDELSSDNDDPDSDDQSSSSGRLVFLPDIERHLLRTRVPPSIPRSILPNADGELAGKQLVLYSVPASLSVPEDQDSVRKAIIEARARSRASASAAPTTLQTARRLVGAGSMGAADATAAAAGSGRLASIPEAEILPPTSVGLGPAIHPVDMVGAVVPPVQPFVQAGGTIGVVPRITENAGIGTASPPISGGGDPDAMELD